MGNFFRFQRFPASELQKNLDTIAGLENVDRMEGWRKHLSHILTGNSNSVPQKFVQKVSLTDFLELSDIFGFLRKITTELCRLRAF